MKELIDHILSKVPIQVVAGKVSEVDKDNLTCTVTPEGMAPFTEVRIRSLIDGEKTGFVAIPTDGSIVAIGLISNNDASTFICSYSKVDEYYITLENGFKLHLKDDGTATINGDNCKGLVKVIELTEKLNSIENLVNDLISKYNLHTHTGVLTGTGTSGTTASLETDSLTPTKQSDIENEKIKHGN